MKIIAKLEFDGNEDTLRFIKNGTLIESINKDFLEHNEEVTLIGIKIIKKEIKK